tara:strand:- start:2819 stop:2986 length:168 start_codon:yes stop_codon:yes gene_type:complete
MTKHKAQKKKLLKLYKTKEAISERIDKLIQIELKTGHLYEWQESELEILKQLSND